MNSGALLQVQGLPTRLIQELSMCERDQRVRGKFAGQVLKVLRDEKFTSFIVSDGSATAEVTMVMRRIKCDHFLPKRGDSVKLVGLGFKKILGGGKNQYSFLKILCLCIGKISVQEQFSTNLYAIKTQQERTRQHNRVQQVQKLKPLYVYKTFNTQEEEQDLRTLIFIYNYYVFQHNTDIQSYIFNQEMIRCSKQGREFMQAYGITKDCLEDVLIRTMVELSSIGILTTKLMAQHKNPNEKFFVIKREFFRGVEKVLEEKIIEFGSKGGINIQQLNHHANKKIAEYVNVSFYIFNWKFLQKVLTKLQSSNAIYKTADKMIFPNFRI